MNLKPKPSVAGIWAPIDPKDLRNGNTGFLLQNLSGLLPVGKSGEFGIILAGNAAGGGGFSSDPSAFSTVKIAILLPDGLGGYKIGTDQMIDDPVINGTQSIVVADFNLDGWPDVFLSAENEMPFVLKSSIAYLSNGPGILKKVVLPDSVINHSAILVYIDGKPTVVGTSYPADGTGVSVAARGTTNAIYTFENGDFKILQTAYIGGVASGTMGRYGKNGELEVIRGDVVSGWNGKNWTAMEIVAYPFNGTEVAVDKPIQKITPYLSTLPQFRDFPAQVGGVGLTHTYQLWSLDLNHDNKLDVLAAQTMWSTKNKDYPTSLQLLINNGDGTFGDQTQKLNKQMNLMIEQLDYNPTFLDVDNSGIQTLFFGSLDLTPSRQANYLILNDGTGTLHVGLHDEFQDLAKWAYEFANVEYQGRGYWFNEQSFFPKFIAVPQPTGVINYVAVINMARWRDSTRTEVVNQNLLINLPIEYRAASDFTKRVEITDRNGSTLIRTWAGNDLITDDNPSNLATKIDGGIGNDVSKYSKAFSSYKLLRNDDGTYALGGNGLNDTLRNFERLMFPDRKVALDLAPQENSGQALLLIGAVLGRDLMLSKRPLMGTVIDLFDQGYTVQQLAGALMRLPIWAGTLTPTNSSTDIATHLLTRVNGKPPTAAELASAVKSLDSDAQGTFLANLALTPANIAQVDLVGLSKTGFDYPLAA